MTKTVTTGPVPQYFDCVIVGEEYHLRCKVCRAGWSLPVNDQHPGNILVLLNHAR